MARLFETINGSPALFAAGYVAVMSIAALLCYGADKLKAIRGGWRISEKTLLTLSIAGGALGGLIGMRLFRHKTRHAYFWAVNYVFLAIHIALIVWLYLSAG